MTSKVDHVVAELLPRCFVAALILVLILGGFTVLVLAGGCVA
jgi:hypothetical protein